MEIMLALRREGQELGEVRAPAFYRIFRQMIEKSGRVSEWRLGFKSALCRFPRRPLGQALLFLQLWRRGKIR